jgi:ankyrin repeat protein
MPPQSLPTRTLRAHPDLDQLKRQAKELLAAFRAGAPDATTEVQAHYRGADATTFHLHDAQLVIARAYGFDSWPKLRAYVDGVTVTRLAEAVRANDIATARAMLDARPELVDMDMSEHNEHRVLHYAVLARNPAMVRLLMARGADPDKGIWPHRDATGALTLARDRGYDDIVALIDEALHRRSVEAAAGRADRPDAPTFEPPPGVIPRMWTAATTNDEAAVIALLEEHPRLVHWHQGDGWTPLHQASLMLYLDVARWLIAHGADVNAYEPCYWTPLELVGVYRKNFTPEKAAAMKTLLMSHGAQMTGGAAIVLGDAEWLTARHAAGTLTEPAGDYGLVTRAVIRNRPEMLTLLLDLGLDPNERRRLEDLEEVVFTWGGPLRECVRMGDLALAELLLKRGADPNASIYAGTSPLFDAYASGNRDMIALIERYGGVADTGIVAHFGLREQAQKMLADEAAGVRPRGVWDGGSVAASLLVSAADAGRPEIVRLALEHLDWPPGDERWHWNLMRPLGARADADRDRYLQCFQLMVERAGANTPAPYGRSILHDVCAGWPRETATADERLALATTLLDAGARLDRRDDLLKSTPLGWACRWGRLELVRLFLDRGADPREADAEPWATPQAWATRMGHADVLTCLTSARTSS